MTALIAQHSMKLHYNTQFAPSSKAAIKIVYLNQNEKQTKTRSK